MSCSTALAVGFAFGNPPVWQSCLFHFMQQSDSAQIMELAKPQSTEHFLVCHPLPWVFHAAWHVIFPSQLSAATCYLGLHAAHGITSPCVACCLCQPAHWVHWADIAPKHMFPPIPNPLLGFVGIQQQFVMLVCHAFPANHTLVHPELPNSSKHATRPT